MFGGMREWNLVSASLKKQGVSSGQGGWGDQKGVRG